MKVLVDVQVATAADHPLNLHTHIAQPESVAIRLRKANQQPPA